MKIMSIEEVFKISGYPQPKDKFDESKKHFDYWDMLAFADLVLEKQVKNNDLLHSVGNFVCECCNENEARANVELCHSCEEYKLNTNDC